MAEDKTFNSYMDHLTNSADEKDRRLAGTFIGILVLAIIIGFVLLISGYTVTVYLMLQVLNPWVTAAIALWPLYAWLIWYLVSLRRGYNAWKNEDSADKNDAY